MGVPLAALRALVYYSLSKVIADHAAMAAFVVGEDTTSPYFVRLPQIDLGKSVEFVESQSLLDGNDPDAIKEFDQLLEENITGISNP